MVLALLTVITIVVAFSAIQVISADFSNALTRTNLALLGMQIRAESLEMVLNTHHYVAHKSNSTDQAQIRQELQHPKDPARSENRRSCRDDHAR